MKKLTTELRHFKKLVAMCDFVIAHRDRVPPGTPAAETLARLALAVAELKTSTTLQASLKNRLRGLLRVRIDARTALRQDMEALYQTAHAIAAAQPGFDDKFQMSLWGDSKLLNAANTVVQDAAPAVDMFVNHAMPRDFLDVLKNKIQRFEEAREEYAKAKTAWTVGQRTLEETFKKAQTASSGFDAIIRNTFRDDPVTLEAWNDACRVQRSSTKKKEQEVEPQSA